ncbi:unnamed protein product [Amoebophrya sp. A120]|nr:unnamed protein product [Amoebophrya sp. A120]|eukprot:GSA120T00004034001.1
MISSSDKSRSPSPSVLRRLPPAQQLRPSTRSRHMRWKAAAFPVCSCVLHLWQLPGQLLPESCPFSSVMIHARVVDQRQGAGDDPSVVSGRTSGSSGFSPEVDARRADGGHDNNFDLSAQGVDDEEDEEPGEEAYESPVTRRADGASSDVEQKRTKSVNALPLHGEEEPRFGRPSSFGSDFVKVLEVKPEGFASNPLSGDEGVDESKPAESALQEAGEGEEAEEKTKEVQVKRRPSEEREPADDLSGASNFSGSASSSLRRPTSASTSLVASPWSFWKKLGLMFYARNGRFDISRPAEFLRSDTLRVYPKPGEDLLACQCVLLDYVNSAESSESSPRLAGQNKSDEEVDTSATSTTMLTPAIIANSTSQRVEDEEVADRVAAQQNMTAIAPANNNSKHNITFPPCWARPLLDLMVLPGRLAYSGERYYVPWNSRAAYRLLMTKNPAMRRWLLNRNEAVQKSKSSRTWWDHVRDWLPFLPSLHSQNDWDKDATERRALDASIFDTVYEDLLTPLDAHEDLHKRSPIIRKRGDNFQSFFEDPYLQPIVENVAARQEVDMATNAVFYGQPAEMNRLVEVLVQEPLRHRSLEDDWRREVETSIPEDKYACYVVPNYYPRTCQAMCDATFADQRARTLSTTDLEELRFKPDVLVDLLVANGTDNKDKDEVEAQHKLLVAATHLITYALVRYRETGPRSVEKINFIEDEGR